MASVNRNIPTRTNYVLTATQQPTSTKETSTANTVTGVETSVPTPTANCRTYTANAPQTKQVTTGTPTNNPVGTLSASLTPSAMPNSSIQLTGTSSVKTVLDANPVGVKSVNVTSDPFELQLQAEKNYQDYFVENLSTLLEKSLSNISNSYLEDVAKSWLETTKQNLIESGEIRAGSNTTISLSSTKCWFPIKLQLPKGGSFTVHVPVSFTAKYNIATGKITFTTKPHIGGTAKTIAGKFRLEALIYPNVFDKSLQDFYKEVVRNSNGGDTSITGSGNAPTRTSQPTETSGYVPTTTQYVAQSSASYPTPS